MVCYTGNSTAGRTVTHNLGVAPEMIWLKRRDYTKFWYVYHKDLDASNPSHKYLVLNETDAVADSTSFWNQPLAYLLLAIVQVLTQVAQHT